MSGKQGEVEKKLEELADATMRDYYGGGSSVNVDEVELT